MALALYLLLFCEKNEISPIGKPLLICFNYFKPTLSSARVVFIRLSKKLLASPLITKCNCVTTSFCTMIVSPGIIDFSCIKKQSASMNSFEKFWNS
jgi:hypothetical protein